MNKSSILLIIPILMFGCQLYDLRPEEWRNAELDAANKMRARHIVDSCVAAHGWDEITDASFCVDYKDYWPNFWFRFFFHPWPVEGQQLQQTFGMNHLYTSRIKFIGGIRDQEIWGLDRGSAYWKKGDRMRYRWHKNTSFYLPTYRYFFQMPRWMKDIPLLAYFGTRESNNTAYYIIYGTWESYAPNKEYDQYLFWINKENYRLEMVQYTIREQLPSAHGTNTFSGFRKVDKLLIPYEQTITFDPGDEDVMHQVVIDEFRYEEE